MGVNVKILRSFLLLQIALFFISACAHTKSEEEMYSLASALTKLSASVESTVRYKNPPSGISGHELLVLATKHDKSLLEPFDEYMVLVKQDNKHAIVMVCTSDESKALLEDAGCSAELDTHHWKNGSKSCEFMLDVASACVKGM